jgi:hypothetical protein
MKTFDELDLLIISACKSFSGSQEEDQNFQSNFDLRCRRIFEKSSENRQKLDWNPIFTSPD